MQFTLEKFIEILKDPMCTSFDWEVEWCKIAFYREWHLGNKESYYSIKDGMCNAFLKGYELPMQWFFWKDNTERTSAWTNIISNS